MTADEQLPDLGTALSAEGNDCDRFDFGRVRIDAMDRIEPKRYVFTTTFAYKILYLASFEFSAIAFEKFHSLIDSQMREELATGFSAESPEQPFHLELSCPLYFRVVARLGEVEPSKGVPFRPLLILDVTPATSDSGYTRTPQPDEHVVDLSHIDLDSSTNMARPGRRRRFHRLLSQRRKQLHVVMPLSREQVALIRYGLYQGDKLTMFAIGDEVFIHRYSGFCWYRFQLESDRVGLVFANADPDECGADIARSQHFRETVEVCIEMICSQFALAQIHPMPAMPGHERQTAFTEYGEGERVELVWQILLGSSWYSLPDAVERVTGRLCDDHLATVEEDISSVVQQTIERGVELGWLQRGEDHRLRAVKPDLDTYTAADWTWFSSIVLEEQEMAQRDIGDSTIDWAKRMLGALTSSQNKVAHALEVIAEAVERNIGSRFSRDDDGIVSLTQDRP